ncbi:LacI family DNA-binding transcriptional regulator [Lederbergia ruris]|uniref:LacI family DNA-binding transcriptional regulator n=1 Tax=Lederbergia ruris TaxID=217495 RepID=UPI0039A1F47F
MSVTIKNVAEMAGVSTATVSHVINKTRYVNPDLAKKVEQAIWDSGYITKLKNKKISHYKSGKASEIAFVLPNTKNDLYSHLVLHISNLLNDEGFILSTYLSDGNYLKEKHILNELISNRRIAGIILVPASRDERDYEKLIKSETPFICLDKSFTNKGVTAVFSDHADAIYKSTKHLIKSGHENISLLIENENQHSYDDFLKGYVKALKEYDIPFREQYVISINTNHSTYHEEVKNLLECKTSTAYIAGSNTLTLKILECADDLGITYPSEISIIGFGDNEWCERLSPSLSTLKHNTIELSKLAIQMILNKINHLPSEIKESTRVPVDLTIRESTQNISRGPFGEMAVYPEQNMLTEEEIEELHNGDYKVAISFHYSGDKWTKLHEQAIKDTLNRYGIRLLSTTDAHFDPILQVTQLESLIMQKPDAIIALPTDEVRTAKKFKEISQKTKLILLNNMPDGFEPDDYACWISVNERENGQNAAKILVDHFKEEKEVKIGMLTHGTPFFATKQRDFFAEQILKENENMEIVARRDFQKVENTYDVCIDMIKKNPDIKGLYITWERPALQAIKALEDMNREDIVISTTDLDYDIASYLTKGKMVIGLSSQRPFEQGTAVAIATAKALLGKNEHKSIGVPPYTVLRRNLPKAWRDIIKTEFPNF